MHRSLRLLHGIAPPSPAFDAAAIEDGFARFFQDAYHLKDWLKNDPASAPLVGNIELYIESNDVLSLMADLANGTKHLYLKTTKTGDLTSAFGEMHFHGDPTVGMTVRFEVASKGVIHDAIDLSRSTVSEWEAYLRSVGLVT